MRVALCAARTAAAGGRGAPHTRLRVVRASASSSSSSAPPDAAAAGDGGGSWYAPSSVEARVARKRPKVPGVGRTPVPPSEEAIRAAAGEPGFADVDRSTDAELSRVRAAAAAGGGGGGGGGGAGPPEASPPARDGGVSSGGGAWAAAVSSAMGGGPSSRLVRVSTLRTLKGALPAAVQAYRLLVLPALTALPGCRAARLLVCRETDGEREAADDAAREAGNAAASSAAVGGAGGGAGAVGDSDGGGARARGRAPPGGDTVTLVAQTEWTTAAAWEEAAADAAYTAAMRAMATYMRGAPSALDTAEVAGFRR